MKTLKERDKQSVWHPFNQQKTNEVMPIVSGEGVYVFDENGNKYLDVFSSWWVNIHGHANKELAGALTKQALKLEHVAFGACTHEPAVVLAENILNHFNGDYSKIFYSDNGSTATEVAIKMTLQYFHNKGEKRTRFLAFENGYHGDTFGSMSVTARGGFNEPFESLMFDVSYIPLPDAHNIDTILKQIEDWHKEEPYAGFIFEPLVQGAGGMLMYEAEYLDQIIAFCAVNGIKTIADEVMTGFGRTGKLFAIDYLNHQPDMVCISKAITGGFMALGATMVKEEIYQAFYSDNKKHTFLHGHSYTGNALACALGVKSFELLTENRCLDKIEEISNIQTEQCNRLKNHPRVISARSLGTIAAVEIRNDEASGYFNSIGTDAYDYFLSKGLMMRPLGNVLVIMPPYCIESKEIEYIYDAILQYLESQ